LTIAVSYSAAMSTASAPQLAFSPSIGNTLVLLSGSWDATGKTYVATYRIAASNVSIANVAVAVQGAHAVNGNLQAAGSASSVFNIDTRRPTVRSALPSVATIGHNLIGGGFTMKLHFDKVMNTHSHPLLVFSANNLKGVLRYVGGRWLNSTTFLASYRVLTVEKKIPQVALTVAKAVDAHGNEMTAQLLRAVVAVDTTTSRVQKH
jgi:hypothetical protein